jgi:hypothetical protein
MQVECQPGAGIGTRAELAAQMRQELSENINAAEAIGGVAHQAAFEVRSGY